MDRGLKEFIRIQREKTDIKSKWKLDYLGLWLKSGFINGNKRENNKK